MSESEMSSNSNAINRCLQTLYFCMQTGRTVLLISRLWRWMVKQISRQSNLANLWLKLAKRSRTLSNERISFVSPWKIPISTSTSSMAMSPSTKRSYLSPTMRFYIEEASYETPSESMQWSYTPGKNARFEWMRTRILASRSPLCRPWSTMSLYLSSP